VPRNHYQRRLEALREAVLEMSALVGDRYELAVEAAIDGDETLGRRVIDGDDDVNERYLAIEEECVALHALQQPVASDLRLVTASFKIITDLERVGDLATNLAAYGSNDGLHPAAANSSSTTTRRPSSRTPNTTASKITSPGSSGRCPATTTGADSRRFVRPSSR